MPDDAGTVVASSPPPSASATPTSSPFDIVDAQPTFTGAMGYATLLMKDERNDISTGTVWAALWMLKHGKWNDIAPAKDETTFARVQKDSDAERGKRLCVAGRVIQITTKKAGEAGKYYAGLLTSANGNIFNFLAVGSSGDIVERSAARFCGVVTERYDYSNSGGGTGHAVTVVGMFDLPENRPTAAASPPSTSAPAFAAATQPVAAKVAPTSAAKVAACCEGVQQMAATSEYAHLTVAATTVCGSSPVDVDALRSALGHIVPAACRGPVATRRPRTPGRPSLIARAAERMYNTRMARPRQRAQARGGRCSVQPAPGPRRAPSPREGLGAAGVARAGVVPSAHRSAVPAACLPREHSRSAAPQDPRDRKLPSWGPGRGEAWHGVLPLGMPESGDLRRRTHREACVRARQVAGRIKRCPSSSR